MIYALAAAVLLIVLGFTIIGIRQTPREKAPRATVPTVPLAQSTAPAAPEAPAGWYDDPNLVNTRRYWNGSGWTDHRTEKTEEAQHDDRADPQTLFNWGLVMAIVIPFIGFIFGIVLLGRRPSWGVRLMFLSIVTSAIYYRLFFA